ncbi:endonuclease/exonuclease/phosphatase family protein [Roseibacterium sp. SDUM158017]|uniref:endonuclease/exonuclease/phosphatase family protein n=1 Tax=Roseicyclus salinarum TaxID=3036773 RepID=UPI002414E97E|nr:endonuclease/exonuclease/phosphatase family protein [Roseibacterium sp. SDUM158017]MDG4650520.1 endonuclease/exonuclease/phosphatase family protein [Roseibacterium sp. SDUM158017]
MTEAGAKRLGAWAAGIVLILLAAVTAASFLPLIETNVWWIRFLDFPRLQFGFALALLLVGVAVLRSRIGTIGWVICAIGVLALVHQSSRLYPYTRFAAQALAGMDTCETGSSFTLLIANVQERNQAAAAFLDLVEDVSPDLLLVMETDEWWDRNLRSLQESYPERMQFISESDGAFGMHVFSRLPLIDPKFEFLFDGYTPTAVTGVELPGGAVVQFVGVHPHPPLAWSQPTTLRDASLLKAALLAEASTSATIVAGDFNSVPWESVTRRAARIGGLLDPRIGRGLHPTFSADSLLMSWPLDQILFQEEFGLLEFAVLPAFGSDHHPVMASLCNASGRDIPQAPPEPDPGDIAEAEASIEAARSVGPTNEKE